MVYKRTAEGWSDVPIERYKDGEGAWRGVARQGLMPEAAVAFEVRYFELAPGGRTSFERHAHEHCVVVLRGEGEVRLGDAWTPVAAQDAVHVPGGAPHQFRNTGEAPFGFLCVVDRDRDLGVPIE